MTNENTFAKSNQICKIDFSREFREAHYVEKYAAVLND